MTNTNTPFGRYEYRDGNSKKFWHIILDMTQQVCIASWGRIGNSPQSKTYTREEAAKKIREKIAKGYIKKQGYEEVIGNNSIHFILSDEEGML